MSTIKSQTRLDLTDPEHRRATISLRGPNGRLYEFDCAPPVMAQMLAAIRLEPAAPENETQMQRMLRDYNTALIMCVPPFPRRWWERLPWYIARWRANRALEQLSYHRLHQVINHLVSLAQGVSVDVLVEMAANAPKLSPTEHEAAINEMLAVVAAEMKMPPQEVAELPARDLAKLVDQVGKRLQREEEWRALLAGVSRG